MIKLNLEFTLFFIIGIMSVASVFGQDNKNVLFSGVVFNSDNLTVPLTQVNIVVNQIRGTSTNNNGFFSIKLNPNDTIVFSHIGYISTTVFISDSIKEGKLIAKLFLVNDTVNINQFIVTSFQDYAAFKNSFLGIENDRLFTNAKNNINMSVYKAKVTPSWTTEGNLERGLQKEANKSIYYGQIHPENTLNIISLTENLINLMTKDKRKERRVRLYTELINLQNQNNIIHLPSAIK